MRHVQQRHDPLRLLGRRLLTAAIAVLVLAALPGVWGIFRKERESAARKQQSEARLADLSTREARLREDIARLETDRGKEEALRDRYGLGKKGEHVIVILDDAPRPAPSSTSPVLRWLQEALPWW